MNKKKNQNQKKRQGRPPGSKNKVKKKKARIEIVKKKKINKKITIKPVKHKKLKLNDIYNKDEKFYLFSKYTGNISVWKPGRDKIAFNENLYIIINKFPTENQYFNLIADRELNSKNIDYSKKIEELEKIKEK